MGMHDKETFLLYWGRTVFQWVELFQSCHNETAFGMLQWCTPDGKTIQEQPNYQLEIFGLIKAEISKKIKRDK